MHTHIYSYVYVYKCILRLSCAAHALRSCLYTSFLANILIPSSFNGGSIHFNVYMYIYKHIFNQTALLIYDYAEGHSPSLSER